VLIEGHADEVGDSTYNMYISRERALAVKHLLVNDGVAEGKLKTREYGDARPANTGHDETSMHANRRVEFTVTEVHLPPPVVLPHR
jgi:peptidoglycan-associated lipoprotein